MKKRIRLTALFIAVLVLLSSCSKNDPVNETSAVSDNVSETSVETSASETEDEVEFGIDALLELDGVKSVEEITEPGDCPDEYNLMVIFEQPLDWNDPSKGTFDQRVQLCYSGFGVNELLVNGYAINDLGLGYGSYMDGFSKMHDVNLINIEYRFYGKSVPEDIIAGSPEYISYLNSYNAACDIHHIVDEFKKLIPGTWMMTGCSKGGVATMAQSMYFPQDADLYIPQIAPFCDGPEAEGFFEYIYEEIGNERYGPEQAAEYRKMVLDLQIDALELRDKLTEQVCRRLESGGNYFSSYATPEMIYDIVVMNFAVVTWQYDQDFQRLSWVLEDRGTEDYPAEMLELLVGIQAFTSTSQVMDLTPYFIQSGTELGYTKYDFSYIREGIKERGSDAQLSITEEMEDGLFYRIHLEPEICDELVFDGSLREGLIEWMNTTDCNVILLYGGSDVWYPMRLPDVEDRENFHTFVDPNASHAYMLSNIDVGILKEIYGLIEETVGET